MPEGIMHNVPAHFPSSCKRQVQPFLKRMRYIEESSEIIAIFKLSSRYCISQISWSRPRFEICLSNVGSCPMDHNIWPKGKICGHMDKKDEFWTNNSLKRQMISYMDIIQSQCDVGVTSWWCHGVHKRLPLYFICFELWRDTSAR